MGANRQRAYKGGYWILWSEVPSRQVVLFGDKSEEIGEFRP